MSVLSRGLEHLIVDTLKLINIPKFYIKIKKNKCLKIYLNKRWIGLPYELAYHC